MNLTNFELDLELLRSTFDERKGLRSVGFIESVRGSIIRAKILGVSIGELLEIHNHVNPEKRLQAKVVGFDANVSILCPLGSTDKIVPGAKVSSIPHEQQILGSEKLLGSVINSRGQIIDSLPSCLQLRHKIKKRHINPDAKGPDPLKRVKIERVLETGIKAIDAFTTIGMGQRIAVFAEPGVGKTTLLSSIIKHNQSAVNVIALIGERGREVQEFVHQNLSNECRARTVIVSSTSDE